MLNNLTIGRYYPAKSPVHLLDPRTKLAAVLLFIVLLFLIQNSLTYLFCLATLLILYQISRVPYRYLLRGMQGFLLLLLFTFIFRAFFTPGDPIWSWGLLKLTQEGMDKAVQLVSRISLMILSASLLSYTTTPRHLANGMEQSLSGLKRFGFPLDDIALTVTVAFRFIPVLNDEIGILMDAQAARGVDFQHSGWLGKLRHIPSLVIPIFVSVLRRSADLATAMEARGYSGQNSSVNAYPLSYGRADRIAYLVISVYVITALFIDYALHQYLY